MGEVMLRGLLAVIDRLADAGEVHRPTAAALKDMNAHGAKPEDYLAVFADLERQGVLDPAASFCLLVELVKEQATIEAWSEVGTEEDFNNARHDLQNELIDALKETLTDFLHRHPLPGFYVLEAFDLVKEEFDDNFTGPSYEDVFSPVVNRQMLAILRLLGHRAVAELLENDPLEFKKRRENGERSLIGKTYEEEQQEFLEKSKKTMGLFGDTLRQ
jgi:hypothetical protein